MLLPRPIQLLQTIYLRLFVPAIQKAVNVNVEQLSILFSHAENERCLGVGGYLFILKCVDDALF